MLIENYYKINDFLVEGGEAVFQISLLADCDVYKGHFPGEPVSPGICNIQMIKECAEMIAGKSLFLNNLQICRLTTLVTPLLHPHVEMKVNLEDNDGIYRLIATIGRDGEKYLELKAELIADIYK